MPATGVATAAALRAQDTSSLICAMAHLAALHGDVQLAAAVALSNSSARSKTKTGARVSNFSHEKEIVPHKDVCQGQGTNTESKADNTHFPDPRGDQQFPSRETWLDEEDPTSFLVGEACAKSSLQVALQHGRS